MKTFYLNNFTNSKDFPFFIQYGHHEEDLFVHTHADFNELTIVLSGTATHIVNNEKYTIKKGDMFVVGDQITHGYENPNDFKICNVMYRLNNLLQSDIDITKSAGFHALFVIEPYLNRDSKYKNKLQLSPTRFELVNTMIADMINEFCVRQEGWKTSLYANFLNLVVQLSRAYNINTESEDVILNLALPIAYISNHFMEPISMEELAKMAHMSVRHFSRIFRNVYNLSPNHYIIQYRLQHASNLLKNSDLTISDVSSQCGFNDSTYFTRQFKRFTGFTPRHYRKFSYTN